MSEVFRRAKATRFFRKRTQRDPRSSTGFLSDQMEGNPVPLGASLSVDGKQVNFALYSSEATAVELLLYSENDCVVPKRIIRMSHPRNKSQRVWHWGADLRELSDAKFYAYRVNGPAGQHSGQRFDPQKLLFDPFALALFFPPSFDRAAAVKPGPNDGKAPLGVLPWTHGDFDWQDDRSPEIDAADLLIYELHVKGFTQHHSSGVAEKLRGTFSGLIEKLPYLQELGVNAIELMPIFQYDQTEPNYWGYMPLSFFAPHAGYSSVGGAGEVINEFKMLVREIHRAGMIIILDVVYNHTGEGSEKGPTFAYRGIDNSTYYTLTDDLRHYADVTGTGNTMRTAHPAVRDLVVASLRYWANEMRVDGFRFDLASVFTRDIRGHVDSRNPAATNAPLIGQIESDSVLRDKLLIAEAWDAGGAYQLGRAYPGITWFQWNGKYRDCMRSFLKSDPGKRHEAMLRVYGSDRDLFPDDIYNACRPFQSINYLASHDGFTLFDAVTYNQRRNWANGHNNTDGANPDPSWNCGWEGDDNAPLDVKALRERQIRNFFTVLLTSNGIPMFRAGDEFLATQAGNNNPYNQDNDTSWLDWARLGAYDDVYRFVREMISFRKRFPRIGSDSFWRDRVIWYEPVRPAASLDHAFGYCVNTDQGAAAVLVNAFWEPADFCLSPADRGSGWRRVVDTSCPAPDDILAQGYERVLEAANYSVAPRSVAVIVSY